MRWVNAIHWAARRRGALRLADRLGRSRGRLRLFENAYPAQRPRLTPALNTWEQNDLAAIWIGHATVLLRIGGMTVLTDPVFSTRVGLGFGLMTGGPRRLVAPALSIAQLPPIDLILISHAHFDHLDRPTLTRLRKKTPVVTASNTRDLIADLGFRNITELDWNAQTKVGPLTVRALETSHWGARAVYDDYRGYNAYRLNADRHSVLFGGDTALHDGFKSAGRVDLAILGIGAYDPYITVHASPEQAWTMANHCHAERLLPMHHSTFKLGCEPLGEPIERLLTAAGRDAERIVIREVGGQWCNSN